jgi:ankyrin repeat protein
LKKVTEKLIFLVKKNKGAHTNAKDSTGITPLHNACFYGRIDCVSLLLEKGAVADILENQTNPIHHAAFTGRYFYVVREAQF